MRIVWRKLQPGELDHELIWLLVSVTAALLAVAWWKLGLPWPRCHFRAVTGLPCLTCGTTRSGMAMLQGDWGAALRYNPLAFLSVAGLAAFDLYAATVLVTRAKRLRAAGATRARLKSLVVAGLLCAGANWIYLLRTL